MAAFADAFATISSVAESRADYRRTLAKVAIFSGLTDSELQFLAERAVPRQFAPGEMVFGEGAVRGVVRRGAREYSHLQEFIPRPRAGT